MMQESVDFKIQNSLKCTYKYLRINFFFPGVIPLDPLTRRGIEGKGKGGENGRERKGENGGDVLSLFNTI